MERQRKTVLESFFLLFMLNLNEVCFMMDKRGNKAYRSSEKESNLKVGQRGGGWLAC